MTRPHPRYSIDEHARRGTALYDQQVRPQVEAGNRGRVVALDVDTGSFEVAEDTLTASRRLLARHPAAQIWCVRIGHAAVHRMAFDVHEATVDWHGRTRTVEVDVADAQPLLGMSLMQGSELKVQVMAGGSVTLSETP